MKLKVNTMPTLCGMGWGPCSSAETAAGKPASEQGAACAHPEPRPIRRHRHHPLTAMKTVALSAAEPALSAAVSVCLLTALTSCSGSSASPPSSTAPAGLPLTLVQDVPLPGGASRLDYQNIDPVAKRLYITHLGDGTIHVVDLDALTVTATILKISSVHGITTAPDRHRILATASGKNEAVIIDSDTLAVTARVPTGSTPDGIAYDPVHGKAYVSNEHDRVETVIDLATNAAVAAIDIGGKAGNTVFDPVSGDIMINAQGTSELITIDPATDRIVDRTPLTGCKGNHGLALDGTNHLAFIACEGNAKLLVLDLQTHQSAGTFDTGDTPDVLAFDTGLHRLYVASESGIITVFDEQERTLHEKASAKLADHAHAVAVDQATHRVYFPLQDINGHPVLRVMTPSP